MRPRKRRAAFTLIELLVVVAIIALLIAILLPSLRAARSSAKRTLCAAHLREIAVAWQHYLGETDHRGRFLKDEPWLPDTNFNYGGQIGTFSAIYRLPRPLNRYLQLPALFPPPLAGSGAGTVRAQEQAEVFHCPADDGYEQVRPTVFEGYGTSYQTNHFLVGPKQPTIPSTEPAVTPLRELARRAGRLTISQVDVTHSEVLLLGDMSWYPAYLRDVVPRADWHDKAARYNVAFLDGHVEFVKIGRGLHVGADYSTVPIRELAAQVADLQQPLPDEGEQP